MKTWTSNSAKSKSRLLTTTNAIRLLIVGSTLSWLLFVNKSGILLQEEHDQRIDIFYHGPPRRIHSKNSASQRNKTNIASLPVPTKKVETKEQLLSTENTTPTRNKVELQTKSNKGCLSYLNSQSWLEAERFGNQNNIDDDYITSSILNSASLFSDFETKSQNILKHTMCAKSSRFRNINFSSFLGNATEASHLGDEEFLESAGMTRNQFIQHLSLRLLYLSAHIHQHMYATKEAKYRLTNPEQCKPEMAANKVGKFDFECPGAKFLVLPMKKSGLGSQIRLINAPAFRAGIASDRVVLFMNKLPTGPSFLRRAWELSSCSRRDKQCFFLPDSPCVVTHSEVQNATALSRGERRILFKSGKLPDHLENERVVVMDSIERPSRIPENFKSKIVEIARKFLVDPLAKKNPDDPMLPFLSAAISHIFQEDDDVGDSFSYYGRNSQDLHAFIFYAMRPRVEFADRIGHIVDSSLGDNHQTNLALGLPIRASDKCAEESECPSFETYMSLMQSVRDTNEKYLADDRSKENSTLHTNIILTSESPDIFKAQRSFQEKNNINRTDISFPFKFVTNAFDILQGTGHPGKMARNESKEDILVSSLSSFKLQFYAKYNVGNCCSNFHLLLFDFLKEGCGASDSDHVPECMQDHEDKRFRVCCKWTKTEECQSRRSQQAALQSLLINNTTATIAIKNTTK